MFTPWVKENGTSDENELARLLENAAEEYACFTAFLSDCFLSGKAEQISVLLPLLSDLLELRLFDSRHEFWAYRSMLDESFTWRIADDDHLTAVLSAGNLPAFFSDSASYRLENLQKLDINTAAPPQGNPKIFGNRLLRTTGSGVYELPISSSEDALCVVSYISYDNNGIAGVVDFRLKGFARMQAEKEET